MAEKCPACDGNGYVPGRDTKGKPSMSAPTVQCAPCEGSGGESPAPLPPPQIAVGRLPEAAGEESAEPADEDAPEDEASDDETDEPEDGQPSDSE